MNERVSFEDFLTLLPKVTRTWQRHGAVNFVQVGETQAGFLPPDLKRTGAEPSEPRVVLISAPAAVGKTSLARALSSMSGNAVWDLALVSMGTYFFTGTLSELHSSADYPRVESDLRQGLSCLILDALDEAYAAVGSQGVQVAFDNLVRLLGTGPSSSGRPSAVILGRVDTMDEAASLLSERSVSFSRYDVAFFDEDQARRFVQQKIADRTGRPPLREYDNFLDRFNQDVCAALQSESWADAESFLGYAPVLDALATFYDRDDRNPMRVLARFGDSSATPPIWELFASVIEGVLDRETDKLSARFGAGDSRRIEFARRTYSREVQCELLLADQFDDVLLNFPDNGESDWLIELNEQVERVAAEHPFLNRKNSLNPLLRFTNAAFRDYALVRIMPETGVGNIDRLAALWKEPTVVPSPVLARLLFALTPEQTSIPSELLSFALDSQFASFENTTLNVAVEATEADESIALVTLEVGAVPARTLQTRATSGPALIGVRGLRGTTVQAPSSSISLGAGYRDFVLGPDVSIRCRVLEAEATGIRVRAQSGKPVLLQAERVVGSTERLHVVAVDNLHVDVPSVGFPWRQYRVAPENSDEPSPIELQSASMAIRRTISWYRMPSQMGGSLTYPIDGMGDVLRAGRASRTFHSFMLARGYLLTDKDSFRIELPQISVPTVWGNDLSNVIYRGMVLDYISWSESKGLSYWI